MIRLRLNSFPGLRKNLLFYAVAISLFSMASTDATEALSKESVIIETFSPGQNPDRKIPEGWRSTQSDLSMFSFRKEGSNFFTTVSSNRTCNTIGKQLQYSIAKYPYLSWKWRVHKLPDGATELKRDKNDSGAGIYVIFKGFFKLNPIIKYVWSSSLPAGTNTVSPYNKNTKIVVLESGADKLDQWITEEVNIEEDFKRLFGYKPPEIEGIGILTDSDNTKSSAIADYDDIIINHEKSIVSTSLQKQVE